MADRIRKIMGGDGPTDVVRKFALAGATVSRQSVHKWLNGGEIDEPNLRVLCGVYKAEPAWVRYGIGPRQSLTEADEALVELGREIPEHVQKSLDFLGFNLERSGIAPDKIARYFRMIERVVNDMENKRGRPS